ncbi:MAG: trypsin-like peptidase domain-containing protein [Bacillota bacterium]|nr:trypsin-like peptidase domain-containing protein [Bacillota bacterium]
MIGGGRKRRLALLMLALTLAVGAGMIVGSGGMTPASASEARGAMLIRRSSEPGAFIRDIAAEVSPSVVFIKNISADNEHPLNGTGSGLIIDTNGTIVTNYHVIAEAAQIAVVLCDGREIQAELLGAYPGSDIAVLDVEADGLTPAQLGDSDKLAVGDLVFAIGNPGGEQFTSSLTCGVISGIDRQIILDDGNMKQLLQTDAAINPGNSGGPLVNSRGEVIGINSIKIIDVNFEGMGFAIPINIVQKVIGR